MTTVRCPKGHEFDDYEYWECPDCEREEKAVQDSILSVSSIDILGGRLG